MVYLENKGLLDGTKDPEPDNLKAAERDKFYKSLSFLGVGGSSGHDAPMIAWVQPIEINLYHHPLSTNDCLKVHYNAAISELTPMPLLLVNTSMKLLKIWTLVLANWQLELIVMENKSCLESMQIIIPSSFRIQFFYHLPTIAVFKG